MVQEQHVAAANRLVTSSRILLAAGDDMGSAELLWGAAVQAVHALHHRIRNGHPRSLRALERIITDPQLPPAAVARLPMGLEAAVVLHNHFYTGQLPVHYLITHRAAALDFVYDVLDLAQALP